MSAVQTDTVERPDRDIKCCMLWAFFLNSIGKEKNIYMYFQ